MSSLEPGRFSLAARGDRKSLLFLLACIGISVAAVVFAMHQILHGKQTYRLAKASVSRVSVEVDRHIADLLYLQQNKEQFFEALAAGKIGRGEQIQWGEVLLDVSNRVGVSSFTYQLNESESLDSLHGIELRSASAQRVEINLAFDARHGPEVFEFFELLSQEAPGAYTLGQLLLRREETSVDALSTQRVALVPGDDSTVRTLADEFGAYGGVGVKATLYWYQFEPGLVDRDVSHSPNA